MTGIVHYRAVTKQNRCLVGHNVDFDINVVDAEFFRHKKTTPLGQRTNICTMKASVEWCDLPNHKYPKLIELHKKLFNERIEMVHDAITDTKATFRCFWKLYDLGMISLTIDGLQNKHNCKGDQTDKNLDFSVNREFSSNIQDDFTLLLDKFM